MSFYDKYCEYKKFDFGNYLDRIDENKVLKAIQKETLDELDFLALLSPAAAGHIEAMAVKSRQLTLQHFGRVIFLYTPMYLANYCVNLCTYCGFNAQNHIRRMKLSLDEVEQESKLISATGLRHILILTGESRQHTPVSYISDSVKILKKYFRSISIEIYPLETDEYAELISAGVDGITIYQEVYDEAVYDQIHLKGPKKNYRYRLDTPERACKAAMRSVNIGALLGLHNWRSEAFFTGLHGAYLQDKYLSTELSISMPRIRPHIGSFQPASPVDNKSLVQIMLALRLFLPRAGITVSTRESATLRDNLIGLGVTRMSAGSSTEVGGHGLKEKSEGQFEISDSRSVEDIKNMIYCKGYQPVFKDWQII